MKIQFQFDKDQRSFYLTPEDDLERTLLLEMSDRCDKGSQVKLRKIIHEDQGIESGFLVEMKVNGK